MNPKKVVNLTGGAVTNMVNYFNCTSDESKEVEVNHLKERFKSHGFKVKTLEPLRGMFGKFNCVAYIDHPAFVSGCATVALFDGITGDVKISTGLVMLYGGLSFQEDEKIIAYNNTSELDERLHQLKLVINAIRKEPMDIDSRRKRGEEHE